jgi:hypothetical protein
MTRQDDIVRIGNEAVRRAQRESLEKGIPNVYSKNGVIFYQLPDGRITMETPEMYKRLPKTNG